VAEEGIFSPADEPVQRGLAFLAGAQARDGSFGEGTAQGNVAITALAGLAVLAGGHHPGRSRLGVIVEKATRYVLDQQQESGFVHNPRASLGGPMYSHGFATLFLADAHGTIRERDLAARLRPALRRAVALLVEVQNREGGWRYEPQAADQADLSVTACQVMALQAAANAGVAVPKPTIDRTSDFILRCQALPDGGFRYTPPPQPGAISYPLTAAGLTAMHCCGIGAGKPVEAARRYLDGFRPSQQPVVHPDYFLYGHYYAALAMRLGPRESWIAWYKEVRDLLCEKSPNAAASYPNRRQGDGSWSDRKFGSHYATALALLILQMPKQHLPVFHG
jgi:hypothetical protein